MVSGEGVTRFGSAVPLNSDEQQAWEGVTRWVRGLPPDSPILGWAGVARSGSVVSHDLRS